jgi:hypothetical protein
VADFESVGVEDSDDGSWLEVVFPVPVGFGTPGEDGEVVGEGDTDTNGVRPCFPFITMAGPVVAEQAGGGEV